MIESGRAGLEVLCDDFLRNVRKPIRELQQQGQICILTFEIVRTKNVPPFVEIAVAKDLKSLT